MDINLTETEYNRLDWKGLLQQFNKSKSQFFEGKETINISVEEGIELNIYEKESLSSCLILSESIIKKITDLDNLTQKHLLKLSDTPNPAYHNWQVDLAYITVGTETTELVFWCRSVNSQWVTILNVEETNWTIKNLGNNHVT